MTKNYETPKTETQAENPWDSLTQLQQEELPKKEDKEIFLPETSPQKQTEILQTATKLKEIYHQQKEESNATTLAETESDRNTAPPESQPTTKTLSDKYDAKERYRIERIKSKIESDPIHISDYRSYQISAKPTRFKKAIRLFADKLNIKTKKSEERREREATHIALSEYEQELATREREFYESQKRQAVEIAQQEAEKQALEEQRSLARDMIYARDSLPDKHEFFKKQRIQEIVERELNSKLLTTDYLESEVLAENPGVEKRSVSFGDTEIPVYDLKGLPFSILSTTIDYRRLNKPGDIGTDTYKAVMDNPTLWAEQRDQAEKSADFGTRSANARGDTISTSYRNSERNLTSYFPGDLVYGYEHVDADSIIYANTGDGGTNNSVGKDKTGLANPDIIKELEGAERTPGYNEILLRRYSETGEAKRPDYIVTENGKITEASLRHAKFFNIPIVNIEQSVYSDKIKQRQEELINSITENDSYPELDQKIAEYESISKHEVRRVAPTFEHIGLSDSIPKLPEAPTPLEERSIEVSKLEMQKRLDFITETLEQATKDIVSKGKIAKMPEFDRFYVGIEDVQNDLYRTTVGDKQGSSYHVPGNCNYIDIDFRLKGSSRTVKTTIYDGERVYKADEYLKNNPGARQKIEDADSSFYDKLEPLVLKYFEAYRKATSGR